MKQRVVISIFSFIITLVSIAIFLSLIFFNQPPLFIQIPLAIILVSILLAGLFYAPLSISADENAIYINRSLRIKEIPMQEVESVQLIQPTMGAYRICGSGGFMGYWGWFKERDLGKYFAYYGRAKDCFFVKLRNGQKYMLGCKKAPKMVDYINSKIA